MLVLKKEISLAYIQRVQQHSVIDFRITMQEFYMLEQLMSSDCAFAKRILCYTGTRMEGLITFITGFGILAIIFVIYAESGLLVGFFLPGDSLLFTAGFLVQQGILPINIHLFAFLLFVAAAAGDSTGYEFGKHVGRKLFNKPNSRFFRKDHLEKAEKFYEKHGNLTIVLARFVPIIRTFVPVVAGVSKMSYRHFIIYNLVGALAWTATFTYLGYFAGAQLKAWGINVEVAAIIIIILSISPMLYHGLKDKDRRTALWKGAKRELKTIFARKKK